MMDKRLRTAGLTVLAAAAAGALAAMIIRGQITRHQRDLFNPRAFKRLAALGHISREPASVDLIRLLRDFIAWEPRKMLRERAQAIVDRMLEEADRLGIEARAEPAWDQQPCPSRRPYRVYVRRSGPGDTRCVRWPATVPLPFGERETPWLHESHIWGGSVDPCR